jgi:DNA-binding NarL/FixJ family response regulator
VWPVELVGDAFAEACPAQSEELDVLTPREQEVLQHIARGYLYKEIAHRLGISTKTVEAHVSAVLRKLQLSTRHELTTWAWERLEPPERGKGRW